MQQRFQFLTDFARICFKRCISTVPKTWDKQFFDFSFWGVFRGKKLEKTPLKSPKSHFFVSKPILMKFGTEWFFGLLKPNLKSNF